MASGDTKTEAMLNVLGNGGSGDEFRGCCNTKTQQYILDAIDRVQSVEDEVEEIKNNPDVVDIVDTYADLQAYDTQHLTENDIVRVLQDETHSGNSTYYRFTKNPDTWTFIGEIAGGGEDEIEFVDLTVTNIGTDTITVTPNKTTAEVESLVGDDKTVVYRLVVPQTVGGFAAGTYLLQTVMVSIAGIMASAVATPAPGDLVSYVFVQAPGAASGTIYIESVQDELVSGTNIKTINNQSILGSGNITVEGGEAIGVGNIQFNLVEESD